MGVCLVKLAQCIEAWTFFRVVSIYFINWSWWRRSRVSNSVLVSVITEQSERAWPVMSVTKRSMWSMSVCLSVWLCKPKKDRDSNVVCGLCCLARGGFYLIYLDNGTNGTYCVSMDLFIFTCARTMARILSSISSIVHIGVQFWSWLDLDHSHQYLVCRVLDTVPSK